MSQLICYGEMLMDCVSAGNDATQMLFQANPGGAPANVAIQAARLGISSGFVGKVGADFFGQKLKSTLEENAVSTDNLILDPVHKTTLAFVTLTADGDRDFSFYRNQGADTLLLFDELDLRQIDQADMFCYGSLMLTEEPARSTTFALLDYAKSKGVCLAYDPNWRDKLWADHKLGIDMMKQALTYADLVKMSDEELLLITDCADIPTGAQAVLDQGAQLVLITMGPKGCLAFTKRFQLALPTFDTKVVDTTGSGDSFFGTCLAQLIALDTPLADITEEQLSQVLTAANAAGSTCATKKGAIPALPTMDEIHACIDTVPLMR